LLKATVGAELFGEEWHPVSTKYTNSTENVAVRATMCERDSIDLRHGGKQSQLMARFETNSTLQLLQGVRRCSNSLSLVSFVVIVR
jgi:hypothetical protein